MARKSKRKKREKKPGYPKKLPKIKQGYAANNIKRKLKGNHNVNRLYNRVDKSI